MMKMTENLHPKQQTFSQRLFLFQPPIRVMLLFSTQVISVMADNPNSARSMPWMDVRHVGGFDPADHVRGAP
jgi:hypothetical protein